MATESLIVTITSWLLAFAAMVFLNWGGPFELISQVGAILFFAIGFIGLMRFMYAFLIVKEGKFVESPDVKEVDDSEPAQLPHARSNPLSDWRQPSNTREMVSQPSVTESTTKLLDENR